MAPPSPSEERNWEMVSWPDVQGWLSCHMEDMERYLDYHVVDGDVVVEELMETMLEDLEDLQARWGHRMALIQDRLAGSWLLDTNAPPAPAAVEEPTE